MKLRGAFYCDWSAAWREFNRIHGTVDVESQRMMTRVAYYHDTKLFEWSAHPIPAIRFRPYNLRVRQIYPATKWGYRYE